VFDSHCHPTDLGDGEAVVRQCQQAGVGLLACGYHLESCRAVVALGRRLPGLPVALGLHPWYCAERVEEVVELIVAERPAALGEIGLDLWDEAHLATLPRQRAVLEQQLHLAVSMGLAVTLHSRRALAPLQEVVSAFPGLRGALHAFGGSVEQAQWWMARGFFIGLGGAVTRTTASRARRLAKELPLEAIVVESDLPAIGMQGREPSSVRPWHVQDVLTAIADLRAVTSQEVELATDSNVKRLLGLG
jgi:TatD DNase family protein